MYAGAIGRATPIDAMSPTFKKRYSEKSGHQTLAHFEGVADTESPTLIVGANAPQMAAMLTPKPMTQSNEERLEIKAKA
jgi:hypothetical protein